MEKICGNDQSKSYDQIQKSHYQYQTMYETFQSETQNGSSEHCRQQKISQMIMTDQNDQSDVHNNPQSFQQQHDKYNFHDTQAEEATIEMIAPGSQPLNSSNVGEIKTIGEELQHPNISRLFSTTQCLEEPVASTESQQNSIVDSIRATDDFVLAIKPTNIKDGNIQADRAERKRQRERQRREDVNRLFDDLHLILGKIEKEQYELLRQEEEEEEVGLDEKKRKKKRRRNKILFSSSAASSSLNRAEVIARAVAVLEELSEERKDLQTELQDLKEELSKANGRAKIRLESRIVKQNSAQKSSNVLPNQETVNSSNFALPHNMKIKNKQQQQQPMVMMVPMMVTAPNDSNASSHRAMYSQFANAPNAMHQATMPTVPPWGNSNFRPLQTGFTPSPYNVIQVQPQSSYGAQMPKSKNESADLSHQIQCGDYLGKETNTTGIEIAERAGNFSTAGDDNGVKQMEDTSIIMKEA